MSLHNWKILKTCTLKLEGNKAEKQVGDIIFVVMSVGERSIRKCVILTIQHQIKKNCRILLDM